MVPAVLTDLGTWVHSLKPCTRMGAGRATFSLAPHTHEGCDLLWGQPAMVLASCGTGSSSYMRFTAGLEHSLAFSFILQLLEISSLRRRGMPHGKQAVKGAVCPSLWARSGLFSDVNRQFRFKNTDFSSQLSMDWSPSSAWIWFKALLCYCVNIGHYCSSLPM